jgi:integrase
MDIGRLSARKAATASIGTHSDGGGLYLRVRQNGSRAWVFRWAREGRVREMGLGPLHTVSLSDARNTAQRYRLLLAEGVDPLHRRRTDQAARGGTPTFRECAERFLEAQSQGWSNPKHRAQWASTLSQHAYTRLGELPVDQVDTPGVLDVLQPLWQTKTETASRLRGRIERVLDWAKVRGYRSAENPARWRGHLQALLPAPAKVKPPRHHTALDWRQIPRFMSDLRARGGVGARALEFAILTVARSGEVRGMKWSELDGDVWIVPALRMKGRREHRVPLTARAVAILDEVKRFDSPDLVFPGERSGRPMSDMTLAAVLRRMGRPDITVHGFRSTFRDWAGETTAHPREVCEQALAHRLQDRAEAAYRRGDLMEKRRLLMVDWEAYCCSIAEAPRDAR